MFRRQRSIELMYVRSSDARSASSSCDMPLALRNNLTLAEKICCKRSGSIWGELSARPAAATCLLRGLRDVGAVMDFTAQMV